MRKGRDIIGKTIVAYDTGEKVDKIEDLIFDQDRNLLLGFLIDEGGWFSNAKVLPLSLVKAIGLDAVIVPSEDAIQTASHFPDIDSVLKRNNILKGTQIMTLDGRDLGTLVDLYFDDQTGVVEGYEVSGGLFADAYTGRSFVPAPQTLKIGEDVAFVPPETADLMQEQVGGIKAAVQTASEKMQETAQVANVKLQDASRTATTRLANVIVDPAEQKAFAVGKVAEQTVDAPGGGQLVLKGEIITPAIADAAEHLDVLDALYRSAGGSLTGKLNQQFSSQLESTFASLSVEQAEARRVSRTVYTSEGYIIAAVGQIVTPHVIERAKTYHRESDLLEAVGLSSRSAAKSQTDSLLSSTGEQLQHGTSSLWEKVKETAGDLQERSTQAIEEQRIKGALGRPTTRVILDRNDQVILNVGELITHQAIASARSADVLDVLLSSVYTDKPQLSVQDLRAPEPGSAAL
ncbi:MAG: PRC-barrel domain-containing protein [Aphanocapsa sp. GSE-SYN-MK-11-07L]|jgi:uncharacterized protein YrrD|nr:PRC-barrel domain-containing protein [Aphanocapsa sp. GSE-SYN-MK-11-07L]